MSEEEPSSKRARSDEHSEVDEEDHWKKELRDWLVDSSSNVDEEEDSDDEEGHEMIERLLEMQLPDPISDEAFAALIYNAEYCYMTSRGLQLGQQDDEDGPYTNIAHSTMPYLKKFLTEIPKNLECLRLHIHSPEVVQAFPDQIGNEASALREIEIFLQGNSNIEARRLEPLSLANMLYVTRNIKDVILEGFQAFAPNSNTDSLKAFESTTKRIELSDTVICDESPMFLHPDTTVQLEILEVKRLIIPSEISKLEASKLFWRQWLKASTQTLSTIQVYGCDTENVHKVEGMCIEAANLGLDNIKTIKLYRIGTDLRQSLRHLVSTPVGSTLKRLQLQFAEHHDGLLPSLAPTLAGFENLEDLALYFDCDDELDPNPFLKTYFSLEPPALRKIDVSGVDLSAASFGALFSLETLESIEIYNGREIFIASEKAFYSNLRSLRIRAYDTHAYRLQHVAKVLELLPDLRCLEIGWIQAMDELEIRSIVNAIAEHSKLCVFEGEIREAPRDQIIAFNQAIRLPCLRNRLNASKKRLPLGFIPNVIVRSEKLCDVSGIFQFVKEQFPSYLGS